MKKAILSALFLALFSTNASAVLEWSVPTPITSVEILSGSNQVYIYAAATYKTASCPNAVFVLITDALPGYKTLVAQVLTAKATGANIQVLGECSPTAPLYIAAERIRLY